MSCLNIINYKVFANIANTSVARSQLVCYMLLSKFVHLIIMPCWYTVLLPVAFRAFSPPPRVAHLLAFFAAFGQGFLIAV